MGIIVDFFTRAVCRPATADEIEAAQVALAQKRVLDLLRSKCSEQRIAQAQARAERSARAGLPVDDAVRRAVAWALHATEPTPPNAPAPIAA